MFDFVCSRTVHASGVWEKNKSYSDPTILIITITLKSLKLTKLNPYVIQYTVIHRSVPLVSIPDRTRQKTFNLSLGTNLMRLNFDTIRRVFFKSSEGNVYRVYNIAFEKKTQVNLLFFYLNTLRIFNFLNNPQVLVLVSCKSNEALLTKNYPGILCSTSIGKANFEG